MRIYHLAVDQLNPTIGNAGFDNPTLGNWTGTKKRPIWARFRGKGGGAFIDSEIPFTRKQTLKFS